MKLINFTHFCLEFFLDLLIFNPIKFIIQHFSPYSLLESSWSIKIFFHSIKSRNWKTLHTKLFPRSLTLSSTINLKQVSQKKKINAPSCNILQLAPYSIQDIDKISTKIASNDLKLVYRDPYIVLPRFLCKQWIARTR